MVHYDPDELKDIKPGPIAWMAAHPVAANLAMIVMIIGGFLLLMQSKQEVFPEFDLDIATITMAYPGASPEEVEQGILLAIEDAVKDVEGIGELTSKAFEGYGHVMAEIDDASETLRISQDIKTAVDQITTFPVDAENLTVSLVKNQEEVIKMVLYGSVDENVLRDTAETLRNRLEEHPDISLVEFANTKNYEIHIEFSQNALRRYNLNIPDISNIIARTSLEVGGGSLKTSAGEVLVRLTERRNFAREFKDIPIITNESGSTVFLGDIATIRDTFEDTSKYARFENKPAIQVIVRSTAAQTPNSISKAANDVIAEFNLSLIHI